MVERAAASVGSDGVKWGGAHGGTGIANFHNPGGVRVPSMRMMTLTVVVVKVATGVA